LLPTPRIYTSLMSSFLAHTFSPSPLVQIREEEGLIIYLYTHSPPRIRSPSLYFFDSFSRALGIPFLHHKSSTLQDDGSRLFPHVFYIYFCAPPPLDTVPIFALVPILPPTSDGGNKMRSALVIGLDFAPIPGEGERS